MANIMAVQPSGLNKETPNHVVLGTGLVAADVVEMNDNVLTKKPDYEKILDLIGAVEKDGRSLGGLRGGAEFVFERETERIPVDDDVGTMKGLERVTAMRARMTGTMVELREENVKRAIPTAHVNEKHGGMTASRVTLDEHYLKNLLHISMYGNGDFCVIRLDQPLQNDNTTFSFNEGVTSATMPFNFLGHTDDQNLAPFMYWRVKLPEGGSAGAVQQAAQAALSAAAGTGKFVASKDKEAS